MAVPAIVVKTLAQALASDKAMAVATDIATTMWGKIFRKQVPEVAADTGRQLVELVGNLPNEDEVAAAFAALDVKLTAVMIDQAESTRRLIRNVGLGLGAAQLAAVAIILAVIL